MFLLSRIPISHFLHANTIWRHSTHGQRELLHLYVLMLLVSILDIDSCLLRLELNYISCLPYLKVLIWLVSCHHINYACYHLPTRGRAGIKLGDVDTSQTYLQFMFAPCMICVTLPCFA